MQQVKKVILASMVAMSVIGSAEVSASGFQVWEQDEAGLGNAHAGGAAEANSASTSYYNPAGMVRLKSTEVTTGVALVYPQVKFSGDIAVTRIPPTGTEDFNNIGGQGGKSIIPIPNFHVAMPFEMFGHKAAVGFSVVSVYDAVTDYQSRDDPLVNISDIASVKTVTAGPTFAFAVTEKFSVGIGFDVSYAYNHFTQGVDYTEAGAIKISGYSDNWLKGYAFGGHLGVLYQFTENTRVGVTYFSPMNYHLKGDSTYTSNTQLVNSGDGNASAQWTFPEYVIASAFHSYEQFDFMGTITWTHWSRMQDMNLNVNIPPNKLSIFPLPTPVQTEYKLKQGFKDTFAILLGMNYRLNEKFMLRFGMGYDQSPTNDTDRNLQLPDNDRYMLSMGLQYKFHEDTIIDFGYMHVFIRDAKLDYTAPPYGNTVNGTTKSSADVFGMQLTLKF